jgi:hypothetical protein
MLKMKSFVILLHFLLALLSMQIYAQVSFDLKVLFEGPFIGTNMTTILNAEGLIPLSQPYNNVPWNYNGTEYVGSIPNTDIVDWVLIELRVTSGNAFRLPLKK